MRPSVSALSLVLVTLLLPTVARAQAAQDPFASEPNVLEVGAFGGAFLLSNDHDLFEEGVAMHQELTDAPPELGLRIAYFPSLYGGIEVETAFMAAATALDPASVWSIRGHFIGQYTGIRRFTPFILAGGGNLAVSSDPDVLGDDSDAVFHYGIGAKWLATPTVALRLDGRHTVAPGADMDGLGATANHFEILLGATITLFKTTDPDPDRDGFLEDADKCPHTAGVPPDGCPPKDEDGDGVFDHLDKCPKEAGNGPDGCVDPDPDKDGVPLPCDRCPDQKGTLIDGCPDPDPDHDGVHSDVDKCPNEKGTLPDGCDPDPDKDGLEREADKCPNDPETKNGYADKDGCPDALPEPVKAITGVVSSISFPGGSAIINASAYPALDNVAKVLQDYPELRVQVGAYTDGSGDPNYNRTLSQKRADAVKTYLTGKGVDAGRIDAKGFGPDNPIGDNQTTEGRAKNRRVELTLVD